MKKLTTIGTFLALAAFAAPSAFAVNLPTVPDAGSTSILMAVSLAGIGCLKHFLARGK